MGSLDGLMLFRGGQAGEKLVSFLRTDFSESMVPVQMNRMGRRSLLVAQGHRCTVQYSSTVPYWYCTSRVATVLRAGEKCPKMGQHFQLPCTWQQASRIRSAGKYIIPSKK